MIEYSVKLFRQKIKELAAYVESSGPDEYVSVDFLAFLNDIKELTEIIRIDLARSRAPAVPIFNPNSEYVPVAPQGDPMPPVVEETKEGKDDSNASTAEAPDTKELEVPADPTVKSEPLEVSEDSHEESVEKSPEGIPEVVAQTKSSPGNSVVPKSKTKSPKA